MATSPIRFSGMATGLDTDTIIKQLMKVERAPVDRMYQSRQLLEWKQKDYRDLNAKLLELRTNAFNMRLSSAYKKYSTSSSNEAVVTASASSGASAISYTFNSITSLAKASNIATADGANISRQTSVATGGTISTPIDTNTNNTFKINYNGLGFVDVTLDPGKVYNGITPGGTAKDLVNDIQTKLNEALSSQGVSNDTVKVSLTSAGKIQFTTNDYPGSMAPKSIVLQEGSANDLLKTKLGFATDATTKQVSSNVAKLDMNDSIYNNVLQHRFSNTEDFNWVVNGSYNQALGSAADNITSSVAYNSNNLNNYVITATENQTKVIAGDGDNFISDINYSSNTGAASVYVDGTKYTVVTGKAQSDLKANEVLVAKDDATGKAKFTFKSALADGTNVHIDLKTQFTAVTGKVQADLGANEALIENDGSGNAKFTFKNQYASGTVFNVERHDFEFTTTVYKQDGTPSTVTTNVNATNESMNSLINRINSNSNIGLSVFYDSGTDKIVFNASKTGDNNPGALNTDIQLSGNFLTGALQLTKYTEGSDAVFDLNGLSTSRKDNTFEINGVNFTLKGTATSASPVTVAVTQDVDKVFDSIKSFVDKYNETIDAINKKVTEKRERKYIPLTQDQKDSMKDKDIELWEEKAKAGLLNGDSSLQSITDTMRLNFSQKVEGVSNSDYDQLFEIGITTSSYYQDKGKLIVDEAKLKNALSKNPTAVTELFTKVSSSADKSQAYRETGLAGRIYDTVANGIKTITDKAGSDSSFSMFDNSLLGKEMKDLDTRIYNAEERLVQKENDYYKRFSALETAINKMNSQSSWLSAQLGGAQK